MLSDFSTDLCKFCLALRTGNTDSSLSFRNADLLSAGRAAVDMMGLSLLHVGFFLSEAMGNLIFQIQKFDVFLISFLVISRHHAVYTENGCHQYYEPQNRAS